MSEEVRIQSGDAVLRAVLVKPAGLARVPALVLCHGFPQGPGGASSVAATYPDLAVRLSELTGWAVLTFTFRGAGRSTGDFSISGWLTDIDSVVTFLEKRSDVGGVWIAGSATGAALCLVHAAQDQRVCGVATLAAPATMRHWVDNAPQLLEHARRMGVITTPGFPANVAAWARQFTELDPLAAAAKIPPRPFLVIHGADDEVVPAESSVAITEAAGPGTEHRIVAGAGHLLRHDPRVVALVAGWMSRQDR